MNFGVLLVTIALTLELWIITLWETILFQILGGIAFGGFVIMMGSITADVNDEFTENNKKVSRRNACWNSYIVLSIRSYLSSDNTHYCAYCLQSRSKDYSHLFSSNRDTHPFSNNSL